MWDLSSPTRIKLVLLCTGSIKSNHWATREVQCWVFNKMVRKGLIAKNPKELGQDEDSRGEGTAGAMSPGGMF